MMDLRVDAANIARGSLHPVTLLLENEYPVSAVGCLRAIERQPKFEWHIETGNTGRSFDSGKIVDRKIRLLNKLYDPIETSLVGNGESRVNVQTELRQAYDVSQVKVLELRIVGDIEKDGLNASLSCHTLPTAAR